MGKKRKIHCRLFYVIAVFLKICSGHFWKPYIQCHLLGTAHGSAMFLISVSFTNWSPFKSFTAGGERIEFLLQIAAYGFCCFCK